MNRDQKCTVYVVDYFPRNLSLVRVTVKNSITVATGELAVRCVCVARRVAIGEELPCEREPRTDNNCAVAVCNYKGEQHA